MAAPFPRAPFPRTITYGNDARNDLHFRLIFSFGFCDVNMAAETSCGPSPSGARGFDTTILLIVSEKRQTINRWNVVLEQAVIKPTFTKSVTFSLIYQQNANELARLALGLDGTLLDRAPRLPASDRHRIIEAHRTFVVESLIMARTLSHHDLRLTLSIETILATRVE